MAYPAVVMEFHVARAARDLYQFDQSIFSYTANVVFANFHAARVFAQKMNARRDLIRFPEQAVRASQVNAMGLIDEILHILFANYRRQTNPAMLQQALSWLNQQVGDEAVDAALRQFAEEFPTVAVYRREQTLDDYLAGQSELPEGGLVSNKEIVLEEMLMLWLANLNPAFSPYLELFDDSRLEKASAYPQILTSLYAFFGTQPAAGAGGNANLLDMLRAPALASPHSLTGQLEFLRVNYGAVLGKYLYRLLSSLDLVKEEEKVIFGVGGGGPAQAPDFTGLELEPERFSPDREWMPNLVLMAKNSYVWLDQLSKKYQRAITRLDDVPDEELARLARYGFTGLWLIGLWERSVASKTIKVLRGNADAVASAYSLMSYDIAADLGGEDAYQNLRSRAWKYGIRLASDMVPNHMGIDSNWVMEHPDWFVGLDYAPFPSYSFNGPNLSWNDGVGIYLEDHYFDNSDAAVVFKRVDHWNGQTRYIYHGNDGTSMPWNDTAQLNYLMPEVREAVIQTILHVARKFPVIRFDAAMTLAKRHYQRLWFPQPGSGGDIASRADLGLTKEQFDAAFPEEFWREVVDRVAAEVPDTLLLAEAFWMMEGYFVRTLGMHRVYNSAFMNMLRDEKNQEYRLAIKNTLDFDPEILKRYVNFMNNPDERTAVDQFGKGDKYFGILTLMSTLPGLPMFGHGQIEGFTEKYGMEFRRAYWDEQIDGYLVERHEREVFPLLRKRYLFAEVRDFTLYDFYTPEGYVNEDVFAYSNRAGEERSLVLYHNKFATARGWIRVSVPVPVKTGQGDERVTVQRSLAEGLGLAVGENRYVIFRDLISGLEFIRHTQEMAEQGLYAELEAYKCHVFLDFRQVEDNAYRHYAQLADYLNGRGVPSIDEALREILLQPVRRPYSELVNAGLFGRIIAARQLPGVGDSGRRSSDAPVLDEAEALARNLLSEIQTLTADSGSPAPGDPSTVAAHIRRDLAALLSLPAQPDSAARQFLLAGPADRQALTQGDPAAWGPLLAWLFTRSLGQIMAPREDAGATGSAEDGDSARAATTPSGDGDSAGAATTPSGDGDSAPRLSDEQSLAWLHDWLLGKIIAAALRDLGLSDSDAWRGVGLVRLLLAHPTLESPTPVGALPALDPSSAPDANLANANAMQPATPGAAPALSPAYQALSTLLQDPEVQQFIGANRFQGVLYFNQELFETLLWWLTVQAAVENDAALARRYALVEKLLAAEQNSGFQVEKLLEAARDV